jgi:hypothetical protein
MPWRRAHSKIPTCSSKATWSWTLIVALVALGAWGLAGTLFRKAPVAAQR